MPALCFAFVSAGFLLDSFVPSVVGFCCEATSVRILSDNQDRSIKNYVVWK